MDTISDVTLRHELEPVEVSAGIKLFVSLLHISAFTQEQKKKRNTEEKQAQTNEKQEINVHMHQSPCNSSNTSQTASVWLGCNSASPEVLLCVRLRVQIYQLNCCDGHRS